MKNSISRSATGSVSHQRFISAMKETLFFLFAAVLLNMIIGGNGFMSMELHPFWIIVLLITVQYGAKEALAAALLATVFLLVGNLPEQNLTETMYGYILRVAFLPFLWIATALVLGSIRSRQELEKQHLEERLTICETAKDDIARAYNCLKEAKEQLELRLAEEKRSVLTVYNVAKSLETLDPEDALTEVSKLVQTAFTPGKFSLYRYDGKALRVEATYGWGKSSAFSPRFDRNTLLARAVLEKKRMLSVANEQDEKLLDGQGMLAGPIYDTKTGTIYGMLKIEEIAFMDMGIRTYETFRIVCEWIGRVYANVEKYQSTQDHANKMIRLPGNILRYPIQYATDTMAAA